MPNHSPWFHLFYMYVFLTLFPFSLFLAVMFCMVHHGSMLLVPFESHVVFASGWCAPCCAGWF